MATAHDDDLPKRREMVLEFTLGPEHQLHYVVQPKGVDGDGLDEPGPLIASRPGCETPEIREIERAGSIYWSIEGEGGVRTLWVIAFHNGVVTRF
ncbi:hypothetical protein SNOG_05266 [Parastagonospora nodorum SN15]|uniref:Uncharacterized protein n=1 Tax=Phaeosphaeria nodorum (strain SN15 / ATCC MYA-4574 / FGSC 10173) TaxID=321614 RepID=Q0USJ8_PHANO|nr:hypothetical protein SNOG_05266 [Parastagonospora nodorum SN15]EAT87657.1 hypothetical protein SNOG_05266 [Parastagonospora nodorum SN15]